jgi:hypothetical protein
VEFAPLVKNDVDARLIDALQQCIKPNIAPGHVLARIHIRSAFDQHKLPSRHMQQKAVDISRLNGTKIVVGYRHDGTGSVSAWVKAIQERFERCAFRRENFGPYVKLKRGHPYSVPGHGDHIHLSVD